MTHRTCKQLSPFRRDAFAAKNGEPLPLGPTARAVVRCPMRVNLYSHDSVLEGFGFRVLVDFASELVGLLAVHAPRLTPTPLLDLAQPLKEQETAWVVRAHLSNDACDFLCCVLVHATDMPPEILV